MENAPRAARFLKAFGHDGRLAILCFLATGDRSVGEIEKFLNARQAAVSQQLARLRSDNLVEARREGKTIFYSISCARSKRLIGFLYNEFCRPDGD